MIMERGKNGMIHLQQLKKSLEEYRVLICFSGQFSQGIVEQLCDSIKGQLSEGLGTKQNPMRVISIFVEQAQNIINYNQMKKSHKNYDQFLESSIVTIGKNGENFFVTSGNIIDNNDLQPLLKKIDHLNSLEPGDLKTLYKEVMKNGGLEEPERSAGLGLIHMARKSRSPIEYESYPINEELSYFQINVNG
ncbi:SiaB family protein kinase [Desulfosporosinus sp. FKB]|uniref:SiaB family protein kinase n=1 Tax=Desulfosporosinus sp. FKB TaxID=1969835 RepID=UPI001124FE19|nr:SiaB family protein kinase [Desulfosporosinus sp. FKB]